MGLTVGLTLIGGKNWIGGYNYLLNLLTALADEFPDQVRVVMMAGTDVPDAELSPFQAIRNCTCVRVPSLRIAERLRKFASTVLLGREAGISRILDAHHVDVVFEAGVFLGWRLGRPVIAWIPDLQHRGLPHLFSRSLWWRREVIHRLKIAGGRTVMLSSEDSRTVFCRHYPAYALATRVVRFAAPLPSSVGREPARAVADRYGLPTQYFFMPNQYWIHKNHALVVEALMILRGRGVEATVMATGHQFDPRNRKHFPALQAAVREAGLDRQFLMPGVVPHEDMTPLMEASVALINPSLFEGWSTSVEEARSLGVPMLLSDLAVHREQAGSDAIYFDRHSAGALANVIASFTPLGSDDRAARKQVAHETSRHRRRNFARDFVTLLEEVSGKSIGR